MGGRSGLLVLGGGGGRSGKLVFCGRLVLGGGGCGSGT